MSASRCLRQTCCLVPVAFRAGCWWRDSERVDVSEPASISAGIAARYARAVFELARDGKGLKPLEGDIDMLEAALKESADLRTLIASPLYTRQQQAKAMEALAKKMKLTPMMGNALALMAEKGRLYILPQLLSELRARIAREKGEITADVIAAKALTKAQADKLAKALKASVGKDVNLNLSVDENLIGGLIVKLGSKMIDTSIAAKLNTLQNAMKEVG